MNPPESSIAFGAPGIEPRWTSSAKEGVGTSYHTSCRLWFTLSHGIVNEIYYPHVDQPNTRDFQFLITDGETFCHEERDLTHTIEYPERDSLFYRLTNSDPGGRYRIVKHVLTDPHHLVLLVQTKLEVRDESLRGKLRLYALLAPHIGGYGAGNSGECAEIGDVKLMRAQRRQRASDHGVRAAVLLTFGRLCRLQRWLARPDERFQNGLGISSAENGNIALTGEINLPENGEFTIAVAFGRSYQTTAIKLFQLLAEPFECMCSDTSPVATRRLSIRNSTSARTRPMAAESTG